MANKNLSAAKNAKNDEFYTQYADIQKEVNAYLEYDENVFRGKTILLPCDDPEWSNFTKFFAQNFERFGLKKLISTSFAPEAKSKKYGGDMSLYAYLPYNNFDAIDVPHVDSIPSDYDGVMGVPISLLDKYCPEQFELVGIGTGDSGRELGVKKNYRGRTDLAITENGKSRCPYQRILIRHKRNRGKK